MEEPTGVREVREWRRQVAKEWEGKTWEQINDDLQRCLLEYQRALTSKRAEGNSTIEDFR